MCLRRQQDWVASAYLEWGVLHGFDPVPLAAIGPSNYVPDYMTLLEPWAEVFGNDAITVIPLAPDFMPKGLLPAFLEACGLSELEHLVVPSRTNESVAWELAKLTARYVTARGDHQRADALIDRFASLNDACADAPGIFRWFRVSDVKKVASDFEAVNESIRRRFFPDRDSPIFSGVSTSLSKRAVYEDADPLELDFATFLPIYVFLMNQEEIRQLAVAKRISHLEAQVRELQAQLEKK